MNCTKKIIDVFATHNVDTLPEESNYVNNNNHEVWQGPVWSVELRNVTVGNVTHKTAVVVTEDTPWIMTSFAGWNRWELHVGDVVRVGNPTTRGFTDYATVLEKVKIDRIASGVAGSGTAANAALMWSGTTNSPLPQPASAGADWDDANLQLVTPQTNADANGPLDFYAYRLNHSINATTPPEMAGQSTDLIAALKSRHSRTTATQQLDKLNFPSHNLEAVYKQKLFPLFKLNTPPNQLVVRLDRGIRAVHWLKLYATTFVNKRQVGFHSAHEFEADDWVAMHIDEIQGEVISNNSAANGAFAVLHAGHHDNATTGAIEIRERAEDALVTHVFEQPRTDLRSLTITVRDRKGNPAHLGRIHLWFKLCVSHG